jgi:cytochrome o ubiquinol oxidase operon protein cyoD
MAIATGAEEAKRLLARPTLTGYVVGFVLSILLTLVAYFFVTDHLSQGVFSLNFLVPLIIILALAQFAVQVVFFLHLGTESKPRWKLAVFLFMIGIVAILVVGSLWIMHSLNVRMSPQQIDSYMNSQDGL